MGHPDGAHVHGSGSGGGGAAVLVVLAAVLAATIARPVIHAATEILDIVVTAVAVLAGLATAGLVALAAVRVRHWRAGGTTRVSLPAPTVARPVQRASEPRAAIERPREVHLHLHGVSAEDIAALLARHEEGS